MSHITGRLWPGWPAPVFDLNGLLYTVSPWTFFQAHWSLNRKVVALIASELVPLEGKRVLDLYAGQATLHCRLPQVGGTSSGEVIAVEENPYAVDDGIRNIQANEIKRCRMVKSSAEKYKPGRKFDVIILDLPRPGLTSEVVKKILEMPWILSSISRAIRQRFPATSGS